MLLRYLRFMGNIIVASSGSSKQIYSIREINELNEYMIKFRVQKSGYQIIGVVTKPTYDNLYSHTVYIGSWDTEYNIIKN